MGSSNILTVCVGPVPLIPNLDISEELALLVDDEMRVNKKLELMETWEP